MDVVKVMEAKLLRGSVIEKLYDTYGTDIRIATLKNMLRSKGYIYIQDDDLKKVIFYLGGERKEGKKYIHVEINEDNWTDSFIWLTPDGVNLAEGDNDEERGVIFNE